MTTVPVEYEHIETVYTLEEARKIIKEEDRKHKVHKKKQIIQKLMGVIGLIITVLYPVLNDGDATICIITASVGIGLMFQ